MLSIKSNCREKRAILDHECSNPPELIRLKCDYLAPEGLESSRTSNGLTQKAVRHPRGTLINYIFTGSRYDSHSTLKVGGIIQHPPQFCGRKILQSFKFTNSSQISSEKITEFLTKFHTVDNDKLMMRNHILPFDVILRNQLAKKPTAAGSLG